MLEINYTPHEYTFTPDLPSEIDISTDATSVDITVECNGNTAFSTTLYPYNGHATFYDIRSVIEGHMLQNNLVFVNFVIMAEVSRDEYANTKESTIIFSRLNIGKNHASFFFQSYFLTTLSSFVIPRNGFQYLTFLVFPNRTLESYTECLVLVEGESEPRLFRLTDPNVVTTGVFSQFSVTVSPANIMSRLNIKGTLLQFTIHRGSLAKTFYVIDTAPNLTLQVRNEFNCFEFIQLTCITKRKLDLDRSTATCLGKSTFYDDKSVYEYEVESSMLTYDQAEHYSQLLLSHVVNVIESNGGSIPILITDISGEISDADNATNSIKFKYKYSSHRIPCRLHYPSNIFDDPFDRTFD